MSKLFASARTLVADRKGVTALEYGLIAAVVSIGIIGGAAAVGTDISELFGRIGQALDGATLTPTPGPT